MLNSIIFINIFSLAVCLIIILLKKLVSQNKKVKLKVCNEKEVTVDSENKLITALEENGINIPKLCGGKGTCGSCKVKVTSGGGEILPVEKTALSIEEQKKSYRLSCQLQIKSDIQISIPERFYNASKVQLIIKSIEIDNDYYNIYLNTLSKVVLIPGQYIQLKIGAGKKLKSKNYTIYKSKEESIYIKVIKDSQSEVDLKILQYKIDHQIEAYGPYDHNLINEPTKSKVFIVEDSSMNLLVNVINNLNLIDKKSNITVFYFLSKENNIHKQLLERSIIYKNFFYFPFIEPTNKNLSKRLDVFSKTLNNSEIYLSGSQMFVDYAKDKISTKGECIVYTWYDSY